MFSGITLQITTKVNCKYLFVLFILLNFLNMGCRNGNSHLNTETANNKFNLIQNDIHSYLKNNIASSGFGGKIFCNSKLLGGDGTRLYIFAYCQEYYQENDSLFAGTGISVPVEINLKGDSILGHRLPRDGNLYSKDVQEIFPDSIAAVILRQGQLQVNELKPKIDQQKGKWYGLHDEHKQLFRDILNKKKKADFYAAGTEPFYTIYLYHDTLLYFENGQLSGYTLHAPFDANLLQQKLRFSNDFSDTMQITIIKQLTFNDLANKNFPYSVIRENKPAFMNGVGDIKPLN